MTRPDRWDHRSSIGAFVVAVLMTGALYGLLVATYMMGLFGYSRGVWSAPSPGIPLRARGPMVGVSYERRRFESTCESIPECQPEIEATVIEIKVARLGAKEPEPNKYPEHQKYEQPEFVEEAVNVDQEPSRVMPLPFKDFIRRKAQLDRKRRTRLRDPFAMIEDKDPRKRATAFERITGRLDGDIWGEGNEQDSRDGYFARVAYELNKRCEVPSSISLKSLRWQVAEVHIKRMTENGAIIAYRIRRRAKLKTFTLAAEATIRKFMPAEGGELRLPIPDPATLQFINERGVIIEFNGRLFKAP